MAWLVACWVCGQTAGDAAAPAFVLPLADAGTQAALRAEGRSLHLLAEDAEADTDAGPRRLAAGAIGVSGRFPPSGGTAFRLAAPDALLWTELPPPMPRRRVTAALLYGEGPTLVLDRPMPTLLWRPGDREYLVERRGRTWLVNAQSGRATPADDARKLADAMAKALGGDAEKARKALAGRRTYNPARTAFVAALDDALVYAALDGSRAAVLDKAPGKRDLLEFSPNGLFVAFARDGNLWLADVAAGSAKALTNDGGGTVSNGKADWVYYEELYDRNWKAFWWSPDSARIAFLRFDDAAVPVFTIVDDRPTHQKLERTAYPKSGDPNPTVRLLVAGVQGGIAETALPGDAERLVPRVGFAPGGGLWFTVQDRLQTWMELHRADPGAAPRRLLRETSPAWVEYETAPTFLKDGRFVWPSEADGYRHLFLHAADGAPLKRLTEGKWEVRKVKGVDEAAGVVTFTANKDDPIAEKAYRAKLDGSGIAALDLGPGDHAQATVSPGGRWLIDVASSRTVPTHMVLCAPTGQAVRTIDANPQPALESLELAAFERLKIPMADGFELEGTLLRPKDFDPAKKYPVWLETYGGPRMPTIKDNWRGGRTGAQALANEGFVVFGVDPRSASGKGAVSGWTCYQRLGQGEVKDLEAAVAWLCKEHPYCDARRVGIEGFSYGGYLTAYCLTHSTAFAAGVAGAGPTDWRNYDSIYTERYMRRPQDNPAGYDAGSVAKAAAQLHGKLLVAHGLMDDNVHPQNTFQFVHALQQAGKSFEMMVYPPLRHQGYGSHFGKLRMDFIKRSLGGPQPAAAPGAAR